MATVDKPETKIPENRSPYQGNQISGWSLSYGAETNDARTITGRFRGQSRGLANQRLAADFYLSGDANGDTVSTPPSGGIAAGQGVLIPGTATPDGLVTDGNLQISATAEKFKTTQVSVYVIGGRTYQKAVTDNLVFSAAHVVTASKFGIILVQINALGTISTKVPGSPQAYNDAPSALAAIPAPDAGNVKLGHIAIAAKAATWTANTDDLTNGSDLTTAAFVDGTEVVLTGPSGGKIVSESDGTFTLVVTHVGAKTFYPILVRPNGQLAAGAALAFA